MYLCEAEEIFAFWETSPPTYQMVSLIAQMLGWEAKPTKGSASRPHRGGDVDPTSLTLTGLFTGAAPDVASDFAELARLATPERG